MLGIGGEELLFVLFLALLVLGPERLPQVARDVGRFLGDLRRTSDELRQDFLNADRMLETKDATPSSYVEQTLPARPGGAATSSETSSEGTAGGAASETPFDREMREARERLRET